MKLDKLMKMKKDSKPMNDLEKDAKLRAIKEMRKMAADEMASPLKSGLKKVSVSSDSSEGLEAGLKKAQDLVGEMPEASEDEASEEELGESEGHEAKEEMSLDEIKAKIAELQSMLHKKI